MRFFFFLISMNALLLWGQEISAITADGRKVLLFPDGKWKFADAAQVSSTSQTVKTLSEQYDVYFKLADEQMGMTQDQAHNYAKEQIQEVASATLSGKTLSEQYDEMFEYADTRLKFTTGTAHSWAKDYVKYKAIFFTQGKDPAQKFTEVYDLATQKFKMNAPDAKVWAREYVEAHP